MINVYVECDHETPSGRNCRQRYLAGTVEFAVQALTLAEREGWDVSGGPMGIQLCPRHNKPHTPAPPPGTSEVKS